MMMLLVARHVRGCRKGPTSEIADQVHGHELEHVLQVRTHHEVA